MSPKTPSRIDEIRARVARRTTDRPMLTEESTSADAGAALAAANAHFIGAVEQLIHNHAVQRVPIGQIAPDTRPEMRQPRLIPLPDQLVTQGQALPMYRELVAELHLLGQSLKERQLQPIVVYQGSSSEYPAARYLILIGHRRWTAASLVGLETIDAVVIEPPSPTERVRLQYAENEDREEFSDMERAWALVQMKQALGENATWEAVEEQFRISRTRRHELTRMLAFTQQQQQQIALLRLQETQIRTLHTAVRNGDLAEEQVDSLLGRLAEIATERANALAQSEQASSPTANPLRRSGIDAPTVARLVARARRAAQEHGKKQRPRWLPQLQDQLAQASRGLQRARDRIGVLNDEDANALRSELAQLLERLEEVNEALRQRQS